MTITKETEPTSKENVSVPKREFNHLHSMLMYADIATVSRELGYVRQHLSMAQIYAEICRDRAALYGDWVRPDDSGHTTLVMALRNLTEFKAQIEQILDLIGRITNDGKEKP